jgi:hypothetical protein
VWKGEHALVRNGMLVRTYKKGAHTEIVEISAWAPFF